jgi:hypothetical protein
MSDEYKYGLEIKLTITTPEGSPQEVIYRQKFLSNDELLAEQAALTPRVIAAVMDHGVGTVSRGNGR